MFYIYLTTNLVDGKRYIGQHKGEPDDSYLGSGTNFTKAVKKYGKENFKKEILCYCESREDADQKEKEIIEKYHAVEDRSFYNLQEGGTGGDGWRAWRRWIKEHPEEAEEIFQKNGERLKQWAEEHPEEAKKNTERMLEASHEWMRTHPEEAKERMKKTNLAKEKWQKEHPIEHQKQVADFIKSGSDANSKRVRCITTGEVFPSISEAARHFGIIQGNISKALKGERKSAGKLPGTKKKLFWEFVN